MADNNQPTNKSDESIIEHIDIKNKTAYSKAKLAELAFYADAANYDEALEQRNYLNYNDDSDSIFDDNSAVYESDSIFDEHTAVYESTTSTPMEQRPFKKKEYSQYSNDE